MRRFLVILVCSLAAVPAALAGRRIIQGDEAPDGYKVVSLNTGSGGGGIVNDKAVMIVFVSPDGATWTLAALGTDGKACLVASGVDWFQRSIPSSQERPS